MAYNWGKTSDEKPIKFINMEPLTLPTYTKGEKVKVTYKSHDGNIHTIEGMITDVYDSINGYIYVIGGHHFYL